MTVTSKFGKSLAIAAILGTVIIGGSTTTKAAETQEYKSDAKKGDFKKWDTLY